MTVSPMGAETLTYDAENRLISAGGATYTYDGDTSAALSAGSNPPSPRLRRAGRAIKVSGEGTRVYSRNPLDGKVLIEYLNGALDRTYAYFNGEHIAAREAGEAWRYTFRDHLGTLRLRTFLSGWVISRHDFYPSTRCTRSGQAPFGGEHLPTATDETHKFTGQERDAETLPAAGRRPRLLHRLTLRFEYG